MCICNIYICDIQFYVLYIVIYRLMVIDDVIIQKTLVYIYYIGLQCNTNVIISEHRYKGKNSADITGKKQ